MILTTKTNKKRLSRGFTLIELLIVIAITAILAGVILVNTSASRVKGQAASIKQKMRSIAPAGVLCRGAIPTAGIILPGNAGGNLCSVTAATPEKLPLIDVCGPSTTDTVYTLGAAGGSSDNWSLTLTTCTHTPECAGAVGFGITVNSTGLSVAPPACN